MLERSLPFRPRAVMRLLEMRARFDRTWAEALFDHARQYSSPKYQALALAHLGRSEAAARVAARTGSDLLVSRLGSPTDRDAAAIGIAAPCPSSSTPALPRGRSAPAERSLRSDHRYLSGMSIRRCGRPTYSSTPPQVQPRRRKKRSFGGCT